MSRILTIMLNVIILNVAVLGVLAPSTYKAHLHHGKNRTKLVRFNK